MDISVACAGCWAYFLKAEPRTEFYLGNRRLRFSPRVERLVSSCLQASIVVDGRCIRVGVIRHVGGGMVMNPKVHMIPPIPGVKFVE